MTTHEIINLLFYKKNLKKNYILYSIYFTFPVSSMYEAGILTMSTAQSQELKWTSSMQNSLILFKKEVSSSSVEEYDTLYQKYKDSLPIDYAFRYMCIDGFIEMAKYLWKRSNETINIHADNEFIFRKVCLYAKPEIAKWLWEISKHSIDLHIEMDDAFLNCFPTCDKWSTEMNALEFVKHFEIAKWLWEISNGSINIREQCEYAFRTCCHNGQLEMAKWLWETSKGRINLHACREYAFNKACVNEHFHIVRWLWKISNGTIDFSQCAMAKELLSYPRWRSQNKPLAIWLIEKLSK